LLTIPVEPGKKLAEAIRRGFSGKNASNAAPVGYFLNKSLVAAAIFRVCRRLTGEFQTCRPARPSLRRRPRVPVETLAFIAAGGEKGFGLASPAGKNVMAPGPV
jgi:hypothetical protein